MDRLVTPDVKHLNLTFKKNQKSSTTFRLTNLMHTMHVAISLTTTKPSLFTFSPSHLSVLPPLSSSSFTLFLTNPSTHPPFSSPNDSDSVTVRSSILPIGKAHQDDLRRLFTRPGSHIFKDAVLPISFVGSDVVEFILACSDKSGAWDLRLTKAIYGCSISQLTWLLTAAIKSGNEGFVKELIDAGGDVSFRNPNSESVLSVAVRSGHAEIVRLLIASGCMVDNSVDLVLHDASAKNRVDLMKVLCAGFDEIDVNSVDSDKRSALHVAAIRGHVEALKFLVSMGGNADVVDSNQWSPLHFAAHQGHQKAVEFLLDHSSFVKYAKTEDGKTAFQLALDNGHSNLYDLLRLNDVLNRASTTEDVNKMKSCLSEGANVDNRDQNGWTPLHRAAFKGKIESVKVLIGHGALVNVVDDAGYTPLHCALEAGQMQIALFLISNGANANLKSLKGLIPFNNNNMDFVKNDCSVDFPVCCDKDTS